MVKSCQYASDIKRVVTGPSNFAGNRGAQGHGLPVTGRVAPKCKVSLYARAVKMKAS